MVGVDVWVIVGVMEAVDVSVAASGLKGLKPAQPSNKDKSKMQKKIRRIRINSKRRRRLWAVQGRMEPIEYHASYTIELSLELFPRVKV
jgi:hypothetical protein